MSNTIRFCNPAWTLGVEAFDRWSQDRIKSRKHQQKDRKSKAKHDRFIKRSRNSLFNLKKKIEQLKLKEESRTTQCYQKKGIAGPLLYIEAKLKGKQALEIAQDKKKV